MNHNRLFGYAAIIASLGLLLQSILPANAFNSSQISMGSNPIEDATTNCSGTNSSAWRCGKTTAAGFEVVFDHLGLVWMVAPF